MRLCTLGRLQLGAEVFVLAQRPAQPRQVVQRQAMLRRARQRTAVGRLRLLRAAQGLQGVAVVVMGIGHVQTQALCALMRGQRFGVALAAMQSHGAVVVQGRALGRHLQRCSERGQGRRQIAALLFEHGAQLQRVGVLGLELQGRVQRFQREVRIAQGTQRSSPVVVRLGQLRLALRGLTPAGFGRGPVLQVFLHVAEGEPDARLLRVHAKHRTEGFLGRGPVAAGQRGLGALLQRVELGSHQDARPFLLRARLTLGSTAGALKA